MWRVVVPPRPGAGRTSRAGTASRRPARATAPWSNTVRWSRPSPSSGRFWPTNRRWCPNRWPGIGKWLLLSRSASLTTASMVPASFPTSHPASRERPCAGCPAAAASSSGWGMRLGGGRWSRGRRLRVCQRDASRIFPPPLIVFPTINWRGRLRVPLAWIRNINVRGAQECCGARHLARDGPY